MRHKINIALNELPDVTRLATMQDIILDVAVMLDNGQEVDERDLALVIDILRSVNMACNKMSEQIGDVIEEMCDE